MISLPLISISLIPIELGHEGELGQEVLRLLFLVSIALAFAVYTRLHLVGGGSVSGGYLALLALAGQWATVAGVIIATTITVAVMRGFVLRYLPLPRQIVFTVGVFIGALTTTAMQALGAISDLPIPLLAVLTTLGSFVVPGLLAYDIAHQGTLRTVLAVALVSCGTIVIGFVLAGFLATLPPGIDWDPSFSSRIPADAIALAVIAVIVAGGVTRFTLGLRSGGFIGALFVAEFLTPEAFLTVGASATVTAVIVRWLNVRIVMTPRQMGMVALMLGALIAWASMFWAGAGGWEPAQQAYAFTFSPLLAVGLIAHDMVRPGSGILRTLAGTGLAIVALEIVLAVARLWGLAAGWLAVAALALWLLPAARVVRARVRAAERTGRERPRAPSRSSDDHSPAP